jgi:prepilin peptidase CpaA
LAAGANGLGGLGNALAGAAVGLACLMPLYLAKGMGAGDVKLMAGAGAFLGPLNAFLAAMLTLVAGAVLGILLIVFRVVERSRAPSVVASNVGTVQLSGERFPYATAIAAGVFLTLWLRGLLKPLAGSLT